MSLNLTQNAVEYLKSHPDERFTSRQLAEWFVATYPDQCQQKKERSERLVTDDDLLQQILREISSQIPRITDPHIRSTEGRPRKFYYTEKSEEAEVLEAETATEQTNVATITHEHDLYPILSEYLETEFDLMPERIDEKKSHNRHGPGGNQWLFPDLVALEDLSAGWHREIKDCVKECGDRKSRLWAFEVKRLVNRSNIRQVFFQTVSNASWANFGYLVAADLSGKDTLAELRVLHGIHGIGFINLDIQNPADSQILIPARKRPEIDWDTANRLAEENKDFLRFIQQVRRFHQTGDRPHALGSAAS